MHGKLTKTYRLYTRILTFLQCPFLATIRIIWGYKFFETGKGKLGSLDSVTQYFTELHIPMPHLNAIVASTTECVGGLLLMLGLGARLVSLPLTITMVVAYLTAHRLEVHNIDDFVKAPPFPFLFTAVTILIFGPGKLSADYLLGRIVFKQNSRGCDSPTQSGR